MLGFGMLGERGREGKESGWDRVDVYLQLALVEL